VRVHSGDAYEVGRGRRLALEAGRRLALEAGRWRRFLAAHRRRSPWRKGRDRGDRV
jgi:hypothetical protein